MKPLKQKHQKKSCIRLSIFFQDPTLLHFNPIALPINLIPATPLQTSNQQNVQSSLTPAFLSRFPRSLSSLSLGGKKKSIDNKDSNLISPNTSANSDILSSMQSSMSTSNFGNQHHHSSHSALMASVKNKFTGSTKDLKSKSVDQPPPLPQRNITRRSQAASTGSAHIFDGVDGDGRRNNAPISDLDLLNLSTSINSGNISAPNIKLNQDSNANNNNINAANETTSKSKTPSGKGSSSSSSSSSSSASKVKKRNKTKLKANSDPKISAQLFIQAERDYDKQDLVAATGHSVANEPPPLPPRQPGMLEENQNMLNNNKCTSTAINNRNSAENRPSPNSLETRMNYPLIATATAVRDNISPFPLSNRPNIKQRLQQTSHQHHSTSNSSSVSKSCVSNFHLCHVPTLKNSHNNISSHKHTHSLPSQLKNIHTFSLKSHPNSETIKIQEKRK